MAQKIKILLVDDEKSILDEFEHTLKTLTSYEVRTVSDSAQAISLCQKEQFDVLVTDVRMPKMDGVEAIKKIREFDKSIPIIVISAYVDDPKASEAMRYGISGIFCKHKDFQEGLSLLESALRVHKNLKRNP